MIEAYPLCWPAGQPRTNYPLRARFKISFAGARDSVISQVRKLGGSQIIISTNIPLKKDGFPYASYKTPTDQGVAVYFIYDREQMVFACDKWKDLSDNMQAIAKSIEAIRGLDRWGVSEMLKRAFTGFKSLPVTTIKRDWNEVLGVEPRASWGEIVEAWKKKIKEAHPDVGGSHEAFIEVQDAYEEGKKLMGWN